MIAPGYWSKQEMLKRAQRYKCISKAENGFNKKAQILRLIIAMQTTFSFKGVFFHFTYEKCLVCE